MADGRRQQQQQQRQRRRPCFRSVPAHRIIGGGLGRRYDHAALLSDHRFDDGVFDDDQRRQRQRQRQQQQQQEQEPLGRLIGGEARLVSSPLGASMPPPPPPPLPPGSQPGQREVQEIAGGFGARRGERPRHRQPHEEEKEERGAALALLPPAHPPPPPPLAGEVSEPGAEDTAPQPPGGIRVENSINNNVNNSHNGRIRPQPASLPPSPPAGRGGGDPALGFRARRQGGQVPAAAAAAASGWGSALEACPPWGRSGG
ncbi:unnamed protein product, partial [Ectocarpus sp. 12 AP-2014]